MRSKFTLLLLALNLALFGYLLLTQRPWSATQLIDENRRRVLGPEAADLVALEIATTPVSTPETTPPTDAPPAPAAPAEAPPLRLERRDGTWFLASPLDWPANDFAVRSILNQLQFLEHETSFLVSDLAANGQTLADYGLAQPRLVVTGTPASVSTPDSPSGNQAAPAFTLKVGATAAVGERLYVLSPDQRRVHVVGPALGQVLALDLAQLRSDQLFTIPVFEARALTLQSGAANSARTRLRRDQSRWHFEAPITARAAKTPVELAVNDLNALRVARFLTPENAPPPETTGLSTPRLRVTLEGNARRETLHLGAALPRPASTPPSEDEIVELYARFDWRVTPGAAERRDSVLFTVRVPARLLDTLERAQTALRDPRVLDLDPTRVTALSLAAPLLPELRIQKLDATSDWQIAAPTPPAPLRADTVLVERLLQRLQLLEAARFVTDAPSAAELENLGFNRPERIVTLRLAPAPGVGPGTAPSELVLELAQPGGTDPAIYARVANQPFVYALPPDTLGAVPVVPRFYRDRSLGRLPETTRITRLLIRSAQAPAEAPALFDYTASAEAPPPAVATLLAGLRALRARAIVREDLPPTVLIDGVDQPWPYLLTAELDPPPPSGPLTLRLSARSGGSTWLAGSEAHGLVFTLEQDLVDALDTLLAAPARP